MKTALGTLARVFAASAIFLTVPGYAGEDQDLLLKAGTSPLKVGASSNNVVYLHELNDAESSSSSTLGFALGPQSFSKLEVSNAYSNFSYNNARPLSVGATFELLPLQLGGRWGFYGNIGFSTYEADLSSAGIGGATRARLSLIPIGTGIAYLADLHPKLRLAMPYASVGPSYNFLIQGGDGDLMQANARAWTLRKAVGLRHSLAWAGFTGSELSAEYTASSLLSGKGASLASSAILFGYMTKL
ncbi:MAG: hypothetical protein NDJ89_17490 [Oligoflexia bacterium]|nr:hypothetical protein [Oligoflexia bacterium]